ncbi:MAG: laccase domain-containing protein, partial [Thiogranum sp.]
AAFVLQPNGRWLADIYHLARLRLGAAGVDAVYGGGFCTFTDRSRFYSFRRDKITGRMVSLIWLE